MEKVDLREILKPYSNKWVALSSDSNRVVGVANKISDAIKEAHLHNEKEPILTKVPEHYGTFIL
jgi:hypothetical protein